MICAHCSTPVADEARFCHSCGSLVSDAEGQAAATAAMDQSSFLHMERLLREDTKGVYTVKHMLGRGGMAVVYLAEETGLARKVALKVLPPELTFGHGVERFKREARTAAALDHPNIIPIYRIGDGGKLFWYAMKFLEGKSLEDLLKERGAMSLDESIEILEQVADALDYAHEHKVIHRDIKPANVMLDNRNRVIVTDFGIAKALSEGKLTATDSVIGTPYFMSPEQGMGKTVSGASDQYSVAVMAYRMLAGHVPFDGESAIDILHKHCMFPAPILGEEMPDLPPHVSTAVARALSKDGSERFLSVHDFIQAMKDPDFVPKEPARASGVTVVMNADDAKRLRTGSGTNASAASSGKNKTVVPKGQTKPADKTVVASAKAVSAPAPAPAPKSKAGLFAAIAIVVLGGGGAAAYFATKGGDSPATNPSTLTASPPAPAPVTPAPVTPAPQTVDTAGIIAAANAAAAAAAAAKPPEDTQPPVTRPPANTGTKAPAGGTKAPVRTSTQQQSTPVQSAPAPSTPASAPAPAAVEMGKLRLTVNFPATFEIDRTSYGEKKSWSIDLAPGDHIIVVKKDGYQTVTQTVDVKAGDNPVVRITLVPNP